VGGLDPSADSTRFVLSRFAEPDRTTERTFAYRPGGGSDEDPVLVDGDRIFVRTLPDYHRSSEVHVMGAVVRPGRYPIPIEGARVSEVLAMAGGVTERASLSQGHILRPRERWTPSAPTVGPGTAELNRVDYEQAHALAALDSVLVSCDFVALLEGGSAGADVVVRDGDVIQIPEDRDEVRVIGLVRHPGSYPYESDRSVSDYVRTAGGYDKDADKGRTQLAPFRGAPLRRVKGGHDVPPGAIVYVPPREHKSLLERTRETTGFLVQLASLVVIIDTLSR
jgi:protein involved in polysaccharide export with SLBB domain